MWLYDQYPRATVIVGAVVIAGGVVAFYRTYRNYTKPAQVTDQPLEVWVNNADYDESLACDVLTSSPRVVSKWIARSAFYPTLVWTMLKERVMRGNPWMSHIDDEVILGALPRNKAHLLHELGVGLVINTCEEWDANKDEYARLGIEQVVVPIIDYTSPSLPEAEMAVRAMQNFLERFPAKKIYVHCKAGRGRSATVLLCYYVAKGMSPLQAQKLLNARRPQVSRRSWKRKVVKDFVKKYVLQGADPADTSIKVTKMQN